MERSAPTRGTAADGIGHKAQGMSPNVPDQLALQGEEWVFAVRRQEHEEIAVAQILQAGFAMLAPPAPGPFRHGDAVTIDQFSVRRLRLLVRGDSAPDVEVVTAPDIAHGQLLNESRHRSGHAPIKHPHGLHCQLWRRVGGKLHWGRNFPKSPNRIAHRSAQNRVQPRLSQNL